MNKRKIRKVLAAVTVTGVAAAIALTTAGCKGSCGSGSCSSGSCSGSKKTDAAPKGSCSGMNK